MKKTIAVLTALIQVGVLNGVGLLEGEAGLATDGADFLTLRVVEALLRIVDRVATVVAVGCKLYEVKTVRIVLARKAQSLTLVCVDLELIEIRTHVAESAGAFRDFSARASTRIAQGTVALVALIDTLDGWPLCVSSPASRANDDPSHLLCCCRRSCKSGM